MAAIILTQASAGAPTLNGVNGSLCAVLDWALLQKNWAIEYTAANQRIYRSNVGNRHRMQVLHDSAISGSAARAVVRGAENASSTILLTDPFPTVAQTANNACNWLCSTTANATARDFILVVDDTYVLYLAKVNGTSWEIGFWGDAEGIETGDVYGTCILQRNAASDTISLFLSTSIMRTDLGSGGVFLYWCRDRTGVTKSTTGTLRGVNGNTAIGAITNYPAARAGYANRVRREKIGIDDTGGTATTPTTLALDRRGWLPYLWNPLHSTRGTLADGDTMTDTTYNPSASFTVISSGATLSNGWALVETTATWAVPIG